MYLFVFFTGFGVNALFYFLLKLEIQVLPLLVICFQVPDLPDFLALKLLLTVNVPCLRYFSCSTLH